MNKAYGLIQLAVLWISENSMCRLRRTCFPFQLCSTEFWFASLVHPSQQQFIVCKKWFSGMILSRAWCSLMETEVSSWIQLANSTRWPICSQFRGREEFPGQSESRKAVVPSQGDSHTWTSPTEMIWNIHFTHLDNTDRNDMNILYTKKSLTTYSDGHLYVHTIYGEWNSSRRQKSTAKPPQIMVDYTRSVLFLVWTHQR